MYLYLTRFHITYYIHLIITSSNLIHHYKLTQYLHIHSAFLVIFLLSELTINCNLLLLYQTKQLKKLQCTLHIVYTSFTNIDC